MQVFFLQLELMNRIGKYMQVITCTSDATARDGYVAPIQGVSQQEATRDTYTHICTKCCFAIGADKSFYLILFVTASHHQPKYS